MEKFKIFSYYFCFIVFIDKLQLSNCSEFNPKNNKGQNEIEKISKKKLSNTICNIQNCLYCDHRNECVKCKEEYELYKSRCYSKNCQIYGFCRFCDEYDCLKCIKGFKLNHGICDIKEPSKKKYILSIILPILLIIIIIYIIYKYIQLSREKIKTGQVIKSNHPKSGFYQLEGLDNVIDSSKIKTLGLNQSDEKLEKDCGQQVVNCCVVCGKKNTYAIANCGCSLCFDHYKVIKLDKKIKCRIHNIFLTSNFSFKMLVKSNIKGNALDKLGLSKCPICKLNDAKQSFNCGCSMKVCEKCFNDNVYVLKYNQCPGCGMPYNPYPNKKKKKKKEDYK